MKISNFGKLALGLTSAGWAISYAIILLGLGNSLLEGFRTGIIFIGLGAFIFVETLFEPKRWNPKILFLTPAHLIALTVSISSMVVGFFFTLFSNIPPTFNGMVAFLAIINAVVAIYEMFV